MKVKNITFIGLNYYPEDTAIGLYSSQLVEHLENHGFNVSVITGFPYYPQWEIKQEYKEKARFLKEKKGNVEVFRYKQYVPKTPTFFKRILHIIDFTIGSFFNLLKIKESDLIISVVPFTSSAFLGYIQKKRLKAPLWIHIQDFEFDAALQTGLGNKIKGITFLLLKLEKWIFSKADIASTISQSMLLKLEKKTNSKTFFLPNWIDEEKINPNTFSQHEYLKSSKIKILYSGNIGDKQDWVSFLNFCRDLDELRYQVIVVGDGSKKSWLLEQVKELSNVLYYPPVDYNELSNLLCSADLHVLFQKTEVIDTVMPSKVLGMMASARPSLLIGNEESEVKNIIDLSKGGLYYNRYSKKVISDLNKIFDNDLLLRIMGQNARNFVVNEFSKKVILTKMIENINNLKFI